MRHIKRRQLLKNMGCALATGSIAFQTHKQSIAQTETKKPKFLIVLAAYGGASIIDSALAIRSNETDNWRKMNTFAPENVVDISDSPFRAVDIEKQMIGFIPGGFKSQQIQFMEKHKSYLMVPTVTGSSVTHEVAQHRSLTGNDAWRGRTLQEAMALEYGQDMLLPNVNAAVDGYARNGLDNNLAASVYSEIVADARTWSLGLHGHNGIKNSPDPRVIEEALKLREDLEKGSTFAKTFAESPQLSSWYAQRERQTSIEAQDLLTSLSVIQNGTQYPLNEYGLASSPEINRLLEVFPNLLVDPLEAKAALAFLLIKNGLSASVTIAPTAEIITSRTGELINLIFGFDNSHNDHRSTQGFMWNRVMRIADGLITLLDEEEFDASTGETFWDRTLIYCATDFGRSRERKDAEEVFGTGHDLNNGNFILSPMVKGNQVLGGVDSNSGMTFGWNTATGAPEMGKQNTEAEFFSALLDVLEISTNGELPRVTAFRRT